MRLCGTFHERLSTGVHDRLRATWRDILVEPIMAFGGLFLLPVAVSLGANAFPIRLMSLVLLTASALAFGAVVAIVRRLVTGRRQRGGRGATNAL